MIRRLSLALTLLALTLPALSCASERTVLLKLNGGADDALVTVNDRYIGKLGRLRSGIKVPPGGYRITIEKIGYFPFDALVDADEQPVEVKVELTEIPD